MTSQRVPRSVSVTSRRRSAHLISAIGRMVAQIVDLFQPDKIVLFGSYAYGQPTADSDVDLLVVMPTKNPVAQACRIRLAVDHPFPLDLLVRTPEYLAARLDAGDCFLQDVLSKGKVLYEKANDRVGTEGRGGLRGRRAVGRRKTTRP